MSIDFKLDEVGDIEFSDFDFQLVDEDSALSQRLLIKLRTYRGEWFLDTTFGIPYHQDILGKGVNIKLIESIFKAAILADSEVKSLLEITLDYNEITRSLTLAFKAEKFSGEELDFNEVI